MGHNIAIVGSGICGMCTAMTLAGQGHEITVFEKDGSPPEGSADDAFFSWDRRGAAQFRHPHAFLGLMCNLIEERYPELLDAFYAAGARRVNLQEMLPRELRESYRPAPGDEKLWVLLCRRATIETVIRQYVAGLPGIRIVNPCQVTDLIAEQDEDTLRVLGLMVQREDEAEPSPFRAEMIIDASGRRTRFPRWFAQRGCQVPEEKHDAEIVYYTRHYRLKEGQSEPPRGERSGAGDLGYLKFGVFPGDNGHFAIILCVPTRETAIKKAVRCGKMFDEICLSIPGLEPWLANGRAEATTEPFGIGDINAVWRRYVCDGRPLARNFFAVGDAAIRTNPLYGRGCSTGLLHASILTDVLAEESDPVERSLLFHQRTEEQLRPIYKASLGEDRRGIKRATATMAGGLLEPPKTLRRWFALAFGDALTAASREQAHVLRGVLRSFHLLEKPGEFLNDWRIRRTVMRYMFRGRNRNAAMRLQPGPERVELHELLGLQAPGPASEPAP
ncbi:MAG: FAD-binding protein [Pseudomonadales bacterium]|nr:FAD-binding protein [Pseudomonadales bacterium]NIX07965.1 FAD-binding protein [Pseudomonadales bacterium]